MRLFVHSFDTSWGRLHGAATTKGLALLTLPGTPRRRFEEDMEKLFPDCRQGPPGPANRAAEIQIRAYLDGTRQRFEIPLDVQGTPFQQKVLRQVARIPFGQTRTYGEIARAAGHADASRAVGTANARNHLPIIIPCHRVVAANGLGGYGGGLGLKKRLLELEGVLSLSNWKHRRDR